MTANNYPTIDFMESIKENLLIILHHPNLIQTLQDDPEHPLAVNMANHPTPATTTTAIATTTSTATATTVQSMDLEEWRRTAKQKRPLPR